MNETANKLQDTMFLAGHYKLSIIPVHAESKAPIAHLLKRTTGKTKWKPYQARRPDLLEMSQWIDEAEGLALVTGKVSGILVLDIDKKQKKNKKVDGWKHVKNKHLPPTTAVKTQNGGTHYYYKLPKDVTYRSVNGLFEGVDVKCEGGYVVMPGTDGYEWYDGLEFNGVEKLADIPEWLVKELEPYKKDKTNTQKAREHTEIKREIKTSSELPKDTKDIKSYFKNVSTVQHIMNFLGINAEIGKAFNCILPSDIPDTNPSASITQGNNGVYVYADWRETPEGIEGSYYTLPEVYASLNSNKKTKLKGKAEHATWALRLLADSGILQVKESKQARQLPKELESKPTVKKVYEGFIRLIQIKKLYSEEQETTAFSYRFASAWCGVSLESARQAMMQLETFGYIERGEQAGKGARKVNTYKLI